MPRLTRLLPALAVAAVLAVAGAVWAGPNTGATWTATTDGLTGIGSNGDSTIVVTLTAKGATGLTGWQLLVRYDSTAFKDPVVTNKLTGNVLVLGTSAAKHDTTIVGVAYNRRMEPGGAQLPPSATGAYDGEMLTLTFTTRTAFTKDKSTTIRVGSLTFRAGAQSDIITTPVSLLVNPPAPKADVTASVGTLDVGKAPVVLSASLSGAAGDTITWSATATGNVKLEITKITGDAVGTLPALPAALGTTATTFKTKTLADGKSTITLGWKSGIGTGTTAGVATVAITAGGTTDTAKVVADVPFPAELSAFAGTFQDGKVLLSWTVLSQTNNAGWRVLRSTDNENFVAVSAMVPGMGTSNQMLDYSYADANLPAGTDKLFYVLEQVDLDGKVTRSGVTEVLLGARFVDLPKEFSTMVYPNPFNPSTTIAYNLPDASTVSIIIYDALGQQVRTLVGNADTAAGRYSVQWDARDNQGRSLASGVYFAHITAGGFEDVRKMMLLK